MCIKFIMILIFLILLIILPSLSYSETIILYPTDDAYVDSTNPDMNYGSSSNTYVDHNSVQRSIYKWDLSSIHYHEISKIEFYVYAITHEKGAYTYIRLFNLNNGINWSEKNLSWNNQPSIGTEIYYSCLKEPYDGNQYVHCFIPENVGEGTEYILNISNISISENKITFFLDQGIIDGTYKTSWASKEYINENYHPKLVIEYIPQEFTTSSTTTKHSTTSSTIISSSTTMLLNTTTKTTTSIIYPTSFKMIKPIVVTDVNFFNILFSISLGYPVLSTNASGMLNKDHEAFIENYNPSCLINFNSNASFIGKDSFSPGIFYFLNKSDGFVISSGNKSNAILLGALSKEKNYTFLVNGWINISNLKPYRKNIICDFHNEACSIEVLTSEDIENYLLDEYLKNGHTFNQIALANTFYNESAFSVALNSTFPITFEINSSYSGNSKIDNEKNMINQSMLHVGERVLKLFSEHLIAKEYYFDRNFFVSIFGMPFEIVDDPWGSSFIMTDNVYYDLDMDGYMDSEAGRFCCSPEEVSIQIANSLLWNNTNKSLIMAEYRLPQNMDMFSFDGMCQGFMTEWYLRNYKFAVKRLIEKHNDTATNSFFDVIFYDIDIFKSFEPAFWIEKAYEYIGISNFLTFKHSLLEYDWNEYSIPPEKLNELSIYQFFHNKNYAPIIFYFGTGDNESWTFPSGNFTNQYQTFLSPREFNFSEPKIIYDDHSMSGYPNGHFPINNNFILIGTTGNVYDETSFISLTAFLDSILIGNPIGLSMKNMKIPFVIMNNDYSNISNNPTSLSVYKNLKLMQKENYHRILYGDPRTIITTKTSHVEPTSISIQSSKFKRYVRFDTEFTIITSTSGNETYLGIHSYPTGNYERGYIVYGDSPIIFYRKDFVLPSSSFEYEIKRSVSCHEENNTFVNIEFDDELWKPLLEENYWVDKYNLFDNRTIISIGFVPISFRNVSGSIKIELCNATFEILYKSQIEIIDFVPSRVEIGKSAIFFVNISPVEKANASLLITGNYVSYKFDAVITNNILQIPWYPEKSGNYSVQIVVKGIGGMAGPSEISLIVNSSPYSHQNIKNFRSGRLTKKYGPGKEEQETLFKNERIFYAFLEENEIISYQKPEFILLINKSSIITKKDIVTFNKKISSYTTPICYSIKIQSPYLSIEKKLENGITKLICNYGCTNVLSEISSAESLLQSSESYLLSHFE